MIVFNLIFVFLYINFANSLTVLNSNDLMTTRENGVMLGKDETWHRNDLDNNIVPFLLKPQTRLRLCSLTLQHPPIFHLLLPVNPQIPETCIDVTIATIINGNAVQRVIVLCPCPRPVGVNYDYFLVKSPTNNSILLYTLVGGNYFLFGYAYNIEGADLYPPGQQPQQISPPPSSTSSHNE
ncbi:hypothetical protein PGB90_010475 [Kerria lacca]